MLIIFLSHSHFHMIEQNENWRRYRIIWQNVKIERFARDFRKFRKWHGFVARIVQREILLVSKCQLSSHLFRVAGSRRLRLRPWNFRVVKKPKENDRTAPRNGNGWTFHLFTLPKYLTFDSRVLSSSLRLTLESSRTKGSGRGRKERETCPLPRRKFATLTRHRCGKTHKKRTPKNRRRPKWRGAHVSQNWKKPDDR